MRNNMEDCYANPQYWGKQSQNTIMAAKKGIYIRRTYSPMQAELGRKKLQKPYEHRFLVPGGKDLQLSVQHKNGIYRSLDKYNING